MINPGNTRTFTLTEEQVADVIDSLLDRADRLHDNALDTDLFTPKEIDDFREQERQLHIIADILDGASDYEQELAGIDAIANRI